MDICDNYSSSGSRVVLGRKNYPLNKLPRYPTGTCGSPNDNGIQNLKMHQVNWLQMFGGGLSSQG